MFSYDISEKVLMYKITESHLMVKHFADLEITRKSLFRIFRKQLLSLQLLFVKPLLFFKCKKSRKAYFSYSAVLV